MSAPVHAAARCALCGSSMFTVDRDWQVSGDDLHVVPLLQERGEGLMLCEPCGMLSSLPGDLTPN